jgi:intraflagellar transport protein 52
MLRELPPPSMELFDLDDEFASEQTRLNQLSAKCTHHMSFMTAGNDYDLEFYVRECGEILGISNTASDDQPPASAILAKIFMQLQLWKMPL